MTSQVVLLNSLAVAIASDSFISQLQNDHSYKTRATSEKILPLPDHSVAVMTSGDSELAGYPIESLVWEWSRTVQVPLDTVEQYLDSFLRWLEKLPELGTLPIQRFFYQRLIEDFLKRLWSATSEWTITAEVDDVTGAVVETSKADFTSEQFDSLNRKVTLWVDWINSASALSNLDESWSRGVSSQFSELVGERLAFWFDDRPLSGDQKSQIHLAIQKLAAVYRPTYNIGLVFAGFGSKDLLPKCVSVDLYEVLAGRVRHTEFDMTTGGYHFFGQWKHSVQFIRGIDVDLQTNLLNKMSSIIESKLGSYGCIFPEQSTDLETHEQLRTDSEKFAAEVVSELRDHVEQYQEDVFVDPFMQVISLSPEADLSRMAHTLIEIEAIRQSINQSTPTVGGPIDVAVISKVNGFRWVNHKTL